VPPTGYGGIEAVVSLLADGLAADGHDVTLFASGDSRTDAELVSVFDSAQPHRIGTTSAELLHTLTCFEQAGRFDVVSDHTGPLAGAIGCLVGTPVVHTVHGPIDGEDGEIYRKLAAVTPRLSLISLSLSQRRPAPDLPWAGNCPNGLDIDAYPPGEHRGDYLLFLGRMSPDKGADRAIEVARAAGMPLRIAAKCREPAEQEYFSSAVEPLLGDGIEFLGEVSNGEKIELLRDARATLFPIDWEEPFGLVMLESMACGTPVLATRRGAVPEVVEDGVTGIVVDDYRDMADALTDALGLDPAACRRAVEERFSPERMVEAYVEVFEQLVSAPGPRLAAATS
jgi:glycosyltransferase involved in cell wall biosynthesis